jgi:hypothetical protein
VLLNTFDELLEVSPVPGEKCSFLQLPHFQFVILRKRFSCRGTLSVAAIKQATAPTGFDLVLFCLAFCFEDLGRVCFAGGFAQRSLVFGKFLRPNHLFLL